MTSSLSNFRDIMQLLFRVVHSDALHSRDLHTLVDKIHDALAANVHDDCCSPARVDAFPYHELLRPPTPPTLVIHSEQDAGEIVPNVVVTKEEPEVHEIRNIVVQIPKLTPTDVAILSDLRRDDADQASVIEPIGTPTATSDDGGESEEDEPDSESEEDEAEEDEEAEDEAEEDEEAEDEAEDEEAEDEEAEDEAEEDEDLELKVIKKQRYYWSPSSRRIYECLEEGYGDCLGTYDGSKIIPKS